MNEIIFIYSTCSSIEEAKFIGRNLVESKLIACANILPKMLSIYNWNNKLEEADEVVLLLKTRKLLFESVKEKVIELHSYDTPCVLSFSVSDGSQEYLNWIYSETKEL